MNDHESNSMGRIVSWSLVGLIAIAGVSIAVSVLFLSSRPTGNYFYPVFFPFHFIWFGGIFLIFLVFFAARWLLWPWRRHTYWHQSSNATSILKERYAKGEITKEQFEQMMHDINQ